ncbi:gamma-glutamyltransferase [Phaeobacter sp. HF9A]|uniref:gamma-glutamyltransferase n=1 Tax=Phaeobacter sp. HF9A TaxID=2721561 RepID=UPI00142F9822|nr:gamma-glutamyltransferase [Phaeobacter sp. HF9A]NIZ14061.1 gamma-glutamyltransferase [Phaeobacter sp. HF9A]
MRDLQAPGRSPARSMSAMAATSHPLSTMAALDILRAGGNAMDAAICASAVQAVVEPQSTGIGGDCFALYCPAGSDEVIAFNGSGRAPKAATVESYRALGLESVPKLGAHSVTIPGAIDGWCQLLRDHGRLDLATVLAPAIHYAENGYVVHDRVAFDWKDVEADLAADPHSARIFLPDGKAPSAGDIHRQPELAETLRRIAEHGREGFYEGPVAEDMVNRLQELGGVHTLEDFAATKGDYVTPISAEYQGLRIHQVPPNNQGLTALVMLNLMAQHDLKALDPTGVEKFHLEIETGRLAFRERNNRISDPAASAGVVEEMLSDAFTQQLSAEMDPSRAMDHLRDAELSMSDTVYISIVDEDRNAVSFINSTYYSFGSAVTAPKSGVVLQNRGHSFKLDPAHPNAIAPNKRPLHTIMPGMATKDGRAVMPFGVMGGDYQPFGHVHLLTNLLDHGMDVQEAIDCPRVFFENGAVVAETGVPEASVQGLKDKGHKVIAAEAPHGGAQAIWIDWEQGTLTGGSDPRKDGMALGY